MIHAFPKIFALGQPYIKDILDGEIEITEKVDGCVSTNVPILMANLVYKPAGELKVGDELVGFNENLNDTRFEVSTVTHARVIEKECVCVEFDSKSIVASCDHPFLVRDIKKKTGGLSKRWVNAEDLQPGDQILDVGSWEYEQSYDSGYIAGQFDGEGCVVGVSDTHNTRAIRYYQSPNKGAHLINSLLKERGFKTSLVRREKRKENHQDCECLSILGGLGEFLRFLGSFRPQRLLGKAYDKLIKNTPMNSVKHSTVKNVRNVGIQKVMGLSTSTKTYIADGLLSHNSQFVFGKINGELFMRSKGQQIFPENPQRMFREAVDYVVSIKDTIPEGYIHYCEYLQKPKHNVLSYDRIPKNHLALFAIFDTAYGYFVDRYRTLELAADCLQIDIVPRVFEGKIKELNIDALLREDSFLGGAKIEGFVVKNYGKPFLLGGQPIPLMAGKYVSEAFKELHKGNWKGEHTSQGKWENFKEIFRTEPRWHKAIQHLRDSGLLEQSPKDIGSLLKEVQRDITEEEQHNIKDFLWNYYGQELLRHSVKGFPEFYKRYLVENVNARDNCLLN